MENSLKIEKHLLAYLDIQGFKNAIEDKLDAKILQSVLSKMEFCAQSPVYVSSLNNEGKRVNNVISFKFSIFSDLVVITKSLPDFKFLDFNSFDCFLLKICQIQAAIFEHGFLSRGYLTKGDLYHEGQIIFGEALVEAHEHEKLVFCPRINVDEKVISVLISKEREKLFNNGRLKKDDNKNVIFIDTMEMIIMSCNSAAQLEGYIEKINLSLSKFKTAEDKKIFDKWSWFAEQFCMKFNELADIKQIDTNNRLRISGAYKIEII